MPNRPPKHRPAGPARPPDARPSAAARGYDRRWRGESARFLRSHPRCARCAAAGQLAGAEVVDHVVPHRGDPVLFWDPSNWQPLCKRCHDRKTVNEDGGLGRPSTRRP